MEKTKNESENLKIKADKLSGHTNDKIRIFVSEKQLNQLKSRKEWIGKCNRRKD